MSSMPARGGQTLGAGAGTRQRIHPLPGQAAAPRKPLRRHSRVSGGFRGFFGKVLFRYKSHTLQVTHHKSIIQWFLIYSQIRVAISTDNFGTSSSAQKETP